MSNSFGEIDDMTKVNTEGDRVDLLYKGNAPIMKLVKKKITFKRSLKELSKSNLRKYPKNYLSTNEEDA